MKRPAARAFFAAMKPNDAIPASELEAIEFPTLTALVARGARTRLGRQAISKFMRTNSEVSSHLMDSLPDFRAEKALRLAVFFADSAVISPRLKWSHQVEIEKLGIAADFCGVRADPAVGQDLIKVVRRNLDHLDAIRAELLAKALQAET